MNCKQLRLKRKDAGLSLAALSAKAAVSRWRLIEFELGNIQLRPSELEQIESAIAQHTKKKIWQLTNLIGSGDAT